MYDYIILYVYIYYLNKKKYNPSTDNYTYSLLYFYPEGFYANLSLMD